MSRVQSGLNVEGLAASVSFYESLFETKPHKRRTGYANFEVANQPLKLVLIEVPASERGARPVAPKAGCRVRRHVDVAGR